MKLLSKIKDNSDSRSFNSNEITSNIEEIISFLEAMYSTLAQSFLNVKSTEEISDQTARLSEEGAMDTMIDLASKMNIIENIARQTNLLSLNIAIEASRAKNQNHGKIYSVVAKEVRCLAEKSQKAARDLNYLISVSTEKLKQAGDFLEAIVPEIKKTAELVQEISEASVEQKTGFGEINSSVDQRNEGNASSKVLVSAAEVLSQHAHDLREIVKIFGVKYKKVLH